jgi:hypothetical protein
MRSKVSRERVPGRAPKQAATGPNTTEPPQCTTSGNVTAVGGFFFRTDPAGEVATAGTITLTLDNGTVYSVDAPSANTFVGFTTSSPILSLSVGVEPVGGFLEDFATANDLIVGVAVPEPSMLVLAGLGMGCVLTGCASLQRQR